MRLEPKPYFEQIAEQCGLSLITVLEMLNKGWRYHEGMDGIPCWQSPVWQLQEKHDA